MVLPDGTLAARSATGASFFDYPASTGALVHVGDIRRDGGTLTLTDVTLLGGAVSAVQVIVPAQGTRGLAVSGLIVRGVVVASGVNAVYGLPDGSYAVAAQAAIAAGHTGLVGLRLHLASRHGRLPAGSEILVGLRGPADRDHSRRKLSVLGLASVLIGSGLQPIAAAAGYVYPLAVHGRVIGCPFAVGSTHSPFAWPNNLASDDAIDIAVPVGTPVLAVAAGTIGALIGPLDSSDPHLAGLRLHLDTPSRHFYYAHLSRIDVRPGQHVKAGQQLGVSGIAAGVAHLHFAQDGGNPADTIGNHEACPYFTQYYESWG